MLSVLVISQLTTYLGVLLETIPKIYVYICLVEWVLCAPCACRNPEGVRSSGTGVLTVHSTEAASRKELCE